MPSLCSDLPRAKPGKVGSIITGRVDDDHVGVSAVGDEKNAKFS